MKYKSRSAANSALCEDVTDLATLSRIISLTCADAILLSHYNLRKGQVKISENYFCWHSDFRIFVSFSR